MAAVLVVLALASSAAAEAAPPEPVQDSMVRLSMGRRFHGVVYRDGMVPQVQVHEKILLEGAFLDSGHIVSYLGSHGVDLDHPAVKIVLRPGAADPGPASAGGGERADESGGPGTRRSVSAGSAGAEQKPTRTQVRMAYAGESGWNVLSCKILRWEPEQISPREDGPVETSGSAPRGGPLGRWVPAGPQPTGLGSGDTREPSSAGAESQLPASALVVGAAVCTRQVVSRNGHVRSGWLGVYVRAGGDGPQIDGIEPGSPAAQGRTPVGGRGVESGGAASSVAGGSSWRPSAEGSRDRGWIW